MTWWPSSVAETLFAYFDTSAVVPLLVREPSSELCRRIFQGADTVLTSQLTYVEVSAALAMAARMTRISESGRDRAWAAFQALWPTVDVVAVTPTLARSAATMAVEHGLRGYDAVPRPLLPP